MAPTKFAVHKRAARRISSGHPWVFANELTVPARELPEGGTVDVTAPDGRFLGRGYANPKALIAVRLCTRDKGQHIDLPGFWAARLREAVELRERLFPGSTAYRLVHGESDGVPGLILDRHGDVVVAQVSTLGMEQRLPAVLQALRDVLPQLTSGVLRNDHRARELESLPSVRETWFGDPPESVIIDEDGLRQHVHPLGHERTGHYYDQRTNRAIAASFAADRSVLDVYAGTGTWGLRALHHGARKVTFIDKTDSACQAIADNAELIGAAEQVDIVCDEARRTLIAMVGEGLRFDLVVLDPPPFARSKKAAGSGLKGLREINALAMQLVSPGGILCTTSRSRHIFEDRFQDAVAQAATGTGKRLRVLHRGEQSPDHPVLLGMSESRYLKHLCVQVLPEV